MPPLAVALQQLLTLVRVHAPPEFCATPLLADPVSQQRFAAAWGTLELSPFTMQLQMQAADRLPLPGAAKWAVWQGRVQGDCTRVQLRGGGLRFFPAHASHC